jgi:hypothetical protein
MNFFAEVAEELESGVIGLDITLRSDEIPLTEAFRQLALPFKSKCGKIESAFDFGFLSDVEPPRGLHGVCHGHFEEKMLSHFLVALRRKPDSKPPENLRKASEQIGGKNGMLKILSALEEPDVNWRASLEAVVLSPKRWPLKIKKRKSAEKIGGFKMEQEEIRLKNLKNHTDTVITFRSDISSYVIQIKSTIPAKLNNACFENVSEQLWDKVQALFLKK